MGAEEDLLSSVVAVLKVVKVVLVISAIVVLTFLVELCPTELVVCDMVPRLTNMLISYGVVWTVVL